MADEPEVKDTPKPLTAEDMASLKDALGGLGGEIRELLTAVKANRPEPTEPESQADEEGEGPDDIQLESLPRRQFADLLMQKFQKHLASELKPVVDGLKTVGQTTLQNKLEAETIKFADRTPDFGQWEKEMIAIANENPGLRIGRIYALARAESPEKAAKIDAETAKAAKEAAAAKGDDDTGTRRRRGAGIPPGNQSGETKPGKMSPAQAAQTAWDETIAQFGGNPFNA